MTEQNNMTADERYCFDCIHNEVCQYCPHDGCDFKEKAESVKHGRWILCDDGYVRCSECNRKAFIENDETILTDFCHGCGADMRMDGDYYVYTLS